MIHQETGNKHWADPVKYPLSEHHRLLATSLLLFWTLAIGISLFWNWRHLERAVLEQARSQAEAALDTQAAVRRFVSQTGGIYVDTARGVAPNPHLAHLPERDIVTPAGHRLTLVNSSYLIRLIDEIGATGTVVRVRSTALHPLSADNRPDPWERRALSHLRGGASHWGEIVTENGEQWWREARIRIATPACLGCHKSQNVQPGEMLGALSVRVPLTPLQAAMRPQWRSLWIGHGLFWLVGCIGILWTLSLIHRWRRERLRMERKLETELANKRALAEILAESLSDKPYESRMSRILEITTRAPIADLAPKGAIFLMDPKQNALKLAVQTGLAKPLLTSCEWVPMGHCLCGRAAAQREVVFASCVDERHETHYQGMDEHGHYCVPIQNGDRLLGVFTLYVAHGHKRNPFEDRFLRTVADTLGNLIDRHQAHQALQQRAFYDELTGLPNRALFLDRARHHLEDECCREKTLSAVMFLDLDGFKTVNDALGHEAGDQLLVEVGKRITSSVRPSDTVARLGGDEFTILLKNIGNPGMALRVAERIHQALSRPFRLAGRSVALTASIGIAVNDRSGSTPEALMRDADTAMYQAKTSGKSNTVIFDAHMHAAVRRMLELEQGLRQSLERKEIDVWYQPIMELREKRICGVEALARWTDSSGRKIPPDEFIAVAENAGLIWDLDCQVLDKACRDFRKHVVTDCQREGSRALYLSVNLSANDLKQADFVKRLSSIIRKYGIPPEQICFEVTESKLLHDQETARSRLEQLSRLGYRVALDDFGTGYSSLAYLHQLPAHLLKIDRHFVQDMPTDEVKEHLITAMVHIAQGLGMEVVAEGIETEHQVSRLTELGCTLGQGYFYARPMPARQIAEFCGRKKR